MAPPVASPKSHGSGRISGACPFVVNILFCIFSTLLTIIGGCAYMVKPNDLRLVVVGGSFQMDESLQGNLTTIRFTLRAENPTGRSISYSNISGTLAFQNEYGEKEDHFLRISMTDFDVQKRTFVDSPTQVNATQLSIAENTTAVVLRLNGTMETSSRNSSAGYRCHIWASNDDKACSRVKQHLV